MINFENGTYLDAESINRLVASLSAKSNSMMGEGVTGFAGDNGSAFGANQSDISLSDFEAMIVSSSGNKYAWSARSPQLQVSGTNSGTYVFTGGVLSDSFYNNASAIQMGANSCTTGSMPAVPNGTMVQMHLRYDVNQTPLFCFNTFGSAPFAWGRINS